MAEDLSGQAETAAKPLESGPQDEPTAHEADQAQANAAVFGARPFYLNEGGQRTHAAMTGRRPQR